jgi:hypothetical protein
MRNERFMLLSLTALAAPLLWVVHFAILYLLEGFLCEPPLPAAAAIPLAIAGATLIAGGLCAWILVGGNAWLARSGATHVESHAFLRALQCLLAGLSLVAILWSGAGALLLAPCAFAY